MSNVNLTDWLVFRPAGVVRNARAYIDLPAFSYASQGSAGQASVIVAQYNFSASQDFYLATLPVKPTGVTYGLCIRWRVGETVYRYKLWEDAQFNLSDVVTLYARQRIRANFVLEVWNFPGTASVQGSTIRMITSVRTAPTDFRTITDYALAVGAAFTDLSNVAPTLYGSPVHRWTLPVSWQDSVGGVVLNGTFPNYPTNNPADSTWLRGNTEFEHGVDDTLSGNIASKAWTNLTCYIVAAVDNASGLGKMLLQLTDYLTCKLGSTDKLRVGGWNSGYVDVTIPDSDPHIFSFSVADLGGSTSGLTVQLDGTVIGGALVDPPRITAALPIIVGGEYGGLHDGDLKVADIVMYNSVIPFGFADDISVRRYLRWYHFGEIPLDASFASGSAWLDNDPL